MGVVQHCRFCPHFDATQSLILVDWSKKNKTQVSILCSLLSKLDLRVAKMFALNEMFYQARQNFEVVEE